MKEKKNQTMIDASLEKKDVSGPPDIKLESMVTTRRNFLKATGFSMAAFLASCSRAPVEKAIPFLIQPEEVIPGKAYWYASTSHSCPSGCGIFVKNRDGRPIKIEGNPEHPVSQGGVCPVCQAGILGLYDSKRLFHPLKNGEKSSWKNIDNSIEENLNNAKLNGKDIVILTGTITSPSEREYIKRFLNKYNNSFHYEYDPVSYSAILDAHKINYGERILPGYKFDKADLILSFEADFLGTWISPVQFTKDYRKNRDVSSDSISEHIQIESRLTITGSKADRRVVLDPKDIKELIFNIYEALTGRSENHLAVELAGGLTHNKGRSLVISGINDVEIQVMINRINHYLNNTGKTIDLENQSFQFKGDDNNIEKLTSKLKDGKVGVLMIYKVNPVYELPEGDKFAELMKSIDTTISFSSKMDESTGNCLYVCPEPHFLESWSDDEYNSGIISMTQPVIKMFKDNRSFLHSLAVWSGSKKDNLELIRDYWKTGYKIRKKGNESFNLWWDKLVHDGYIILQSAEKNHGSFNEGEIIRNNIIPEGLTLNAYQSVQLLDGSNSENPWLQELPDPITKTTWDNFASVSFEKAAELNLKNGDVVKISSGEVHVELPVHIQAGQHNNIVAVALGYGRKGTERFHDTGPKWIQRKQSSDRTSYVGKNISPFLKIIKNTFRYSGIPVTIEKTGKTYNLAYTQTYNSLVNPENTAPATMKVRPFVQETEFNEYKKDPSSGKHAVHQLKSMWKEDHPYKDHHWAMAIDLSACTGCSACVVSCQVENNIPVVGRDEVYRRREMHWLRIDRYYSGESSDVDVSFQPMLCQHCDNAPCEPVCPVLATVHSSEGLSQQIYNRCVGTRFCANNCPYKVRRFNWFDYAKKDNLENMILNPDVTVRSRGVMEKCSMCIQRIQEVKIESKANGVKIKDGDIKLACEQSCPADAIVFGDLNDPESRISRLSKDPRHYHVLEELNIRPAIGYMTNIRNREKIERKKDHG